LSVPMNGLVYPWRQMRWLRGEASRSYLGNGSAADMEDLTVSKSVLKPGGSDPGRSQQPVRRSLGEGGRP
jgi:hypothetical protein